MATSPNRVPVITRFCLPGSWLHLSWAMKLRWMWNPNQHVWCFSWLLLSWQQQLWQCWFRPLWYGLFHELSVISGCVPHAKNCELGLASKVLDDLSFRAVVYRISCSSRSKHLGGALGFLRAKPSAFHPWYCSNHSFPRIFHGQVKVKLCTQGLNLLSVYRFLSSTTLPPMVPCSSVSCRLM